VKRWGEPVTLPPMNSHDRRLVHIALKEDTELKTESFESDESSNHKSVIVSLNKKDS
jgi:predicted RNA-binding protein Jag